MSSTAGAVPKKRLVKKGYRPLYASMVVDAHSGQVFHEKNAHKLVYPASLTKMLTLYLLFEALENGRINIRQRLKVSKFASNQMPTKLNLAAGDTISVKEAILGLMCKSANDVAVTVAENLAGSEKQFAVLMNRKAQALGMYNTTFVNASGIPNRRQRTTVKDLVTLSRMLYLRFPTYYRYFSTRQFIFRGKKYTSSNRLLGRVHGVDGIKTGYINASGFNLASSAVRSGHRLVAVIVGGKSIKWRDTHMANLLEAGFRKINKAILHTPIPYRKPLLLHAKLDIIPVLKPVPKPTLKKAGLYGIMVQGDKRFKNAIVKRLKGQKRLKAAQMNVCQKKAANNKDIFVVKLEELPLTEAKRACRLVKRVVPALKCEHFKCAH